MAGRLQGKVALITGTGGGQGRASALLFAREGAKVVGCDLKVAGTETVKMVKVSGGEMVSLQPVELSDANQVKQLINFAIKSYGCIDILFNNAAATKFASIDEMTEEEWHYVLRNELDLVYMTCHYAWPHLKANGKGVIINTASMSGMVGHPVNIIGNFAHAATKGGVIALTKQLAIEGAPYGIRANTISPGVIASPATEEMLKNAQKNKDWLQLIPLKRFGKPEDIASVAVFLASEESSYVTGANIVVDGGFTTQ